MSPDALKMLLARFPATMLPTGNIRTCPVRLSYPNLFKPKAQQQSGDGDGKAPREVYSAALLFPLRADISLLRKAAETAAAEKFGPAWAKRKIHLPFRDQSERADADGELPPGYIEGATFINVTANKDHPPSVRLRDMTPATPADIYPGCWALITLRCFAYDNPARKGVSFGLQNVMKLVDDERIGAGGVARAEREFEPIDGLDDVDAAFAASTHGSAAIADLG